MAAPLKMERVNRSAPADHLAAIAEVLIAELGADMLRFPTAGRLAPATSTSPIGTAFQAFHSSSRRSRPLGLVGARCPTAARDHFPATRRTARTTVAYA